MTTPKPPAPASPSVTPTRDDLILRLLDAHEKAARSILEMGVPDQDREDEVDAARDALAAIGSDPEADPPPVSAPPATPRCGTCDGTGYVMAYDSIEPGIFAPAGEPCPDCDGPSGPPPRCSCTPTRSDVADDTSCEVHGDAASPAPAPSSAPPAETTRVVVSDVDWCPFCGSGATPGRGALLGERTCDRCCRAWQVTVARGRPGACEIPGCVADHKGEVKP